MSKIFCIGECLVDMTPKKGGYEWRIGGAPYNVCSQVAHLGGKAYYIGKLGGDEYSDFLLQKIRRSGVFTDYIAIDSSLKTALAYISLASNGDRSFTFFRDNTADMCLSEQDIPDNIFERGDALHFCSVGLVGKSLLAHKKAIEQAKAIGATVSFDVNMRVKLFESLEALVDVVKEFLGYADIVKLSEEELALLTETGAEQDRVRALFELAKDCRLMIITKGGDGAAAYDRQLRSVLSPAIRVQVKNTTGAGDCFVGALLHRLVLDKIALDNIVSSDVKALLDFANCETAKFLQCN